MSNANNPNKPFTYAPGYSPAVATPEPTPTASAQVRGALHNKIRSELQAADRYREGIGFDESVLIDGEAQNPFQNPAIVALFVAALSFTIPPGRVLTIEKLGADFSDPFIATLGTYFVSIFIDGQRVPFWGPFSAGANVQGLVTAYGSPNEPWPVSPVVVNSNSVLEIGVERTSSALVEDLTLTVRLVGRLSKPVGSVQ